MSKPKIPQHDVRDIVFMIGLPNLSKPYRALKHTFHPQHINATMDNHMNIYTPIREYVLVTYDDVIISSYNCPDANGIYENEFFSKKLNKKIKQFSHDNKTWVMTRQQALRNKFFKKSNF